MLHSTTTPSPASALTLATRWRLLRGGANALLRGQFSGRTLTGPLAVNQVVLRRR